MDKAETAKENDAANTDQDYDPGCGLIRASVRVLGLWRAESLERHWAVTRLNCACLPDAVPKPTYTCVLKCVFGIVLLLPVLSDFLLGQLLPKGDLPNSSATWNITARLTRLLSPVVTDCKTNILIVVFAAVIYVSAFLRKLKRTSGSASQTEEEVPTISAPTQQV